MKFLDLDDFTQGYIVCALWSSTDESRDDGGDPMDDNYGPDDLAPCASAKMIADCQAFQMAQWDHLLVNGQDWSRAGHDFWLTRNGHGAGFWDGDWPEPQAATLTAASTAYGECNLYVGDDGLIYI